MDITLLPGWTTRSSHEINMLPSVKPRGQICLIFWIKFNFVSRAPADWGRGPLSTCGSYENSYPWEWRTPGIVSVWIHDNKHTVLSKDPLPSKKVPVFLLIQKQWFPWLCSQSLRNRRWYLNHRHQFTPPGTLELVAGHALSLLEVRTMLVAFILKA